MNPCQRQGASPRFFGRLQTTATSATASPAASAVPLTDAASPGRERNGASHRFHAVDSADASPAARALPLTKYARTIQQNGVSRRYCMAGVFHTKPAPSAVPLTIWGRDDG